MLTMNIKKQKNKKLLVIGRFRRIKKVVETHKWVSLAEKGCLFFVNIFNYILNVNILQVS